MRFKVYIHSIIDVITNSSTEIFTYATSGAVSKAHEMLNTVLKIAGSDKKSEDLFSIHVEPDDWDTIWENATGDLDSDEVPDGFDVATIKTFVSAMDKLEWKESSQYFDDNVVPYLTDGDKWKNVNCEDGWSGLDRNETSLVIVAKDGGTEAQNICKMFWGLFSQEAMRDG